MSSPHNISTATRIVSYLATEPVNGAAAAPKKEILDQRAERLAGLLLCRQRWHRSRSTPALSRPLVERPSAITSSDQLSFETWRRGRDELVSSSARTRRDFAGLSWFRARGPTRPFS
jgi:hypothetical protein